MTQEELNYIKDSFSQILDDIGGNPDWYDAAKAVASDLGTIERQLEERVTKLPSNFDEAAEVSIDEMNRSITFLIQSITHWFDEEFDHYFSNNEIE